MMVSNFWETGIIEEVCVDMVDMACVAGVIKGRVDF